MGIIFSLLFVLIPLFGAIYFALKTILIKKKEENYTEKQFHFFAFTACVNIFAVAVSAICDYAGWDLLLHYLGIEHNLTAIDKIAICALAIAFMAISSRWAISWSGQKTQLVNAGSDRAFFFIADGASEIVRIIRRKPGHLPYKQAGKEERLRLPLPLNQMPFYFQVRELALAKWPEFQINQDSWVSDVPCWTGLDRSLDAPLIVIAAFNEDEINIERLSQQIDFLKNKGEPRVIAVFQARTELLKLKSLFDRFSAEVQSIHFDDFVFSALPLFRYAEDISQQFSALKIANSALSLKDTYVGAKVYVGDKKRGAAGAIDIRGYISKWLNEISGRQIALLGDYGQGKSSEALALTHAMLVKGHQITPSMRIPILIRLTGVSPKTMTPEEMLGAWGARYGLNGKALLALHQAGRTLLIFDAFDEMSSVADRSDRFEHFAALWKFACPGSKIIFTGRPNFFLDDEELKRTLEISEGLSAGPFCSAVRLAPFDLGQIRHALRWLDRNKVKAFIAAMKRSPQLVDLARRPSLLFQIAQLWQHGKLSLQEQHLSSAKIIRDFVTYSLERQILKQRSVVEAGGTERNFIFLRMSELDAFTVGCAVECLTGGRNNSISAQRLEACIADQIETLKALDLPKRPSEIGALAYSLSQRLEDKVNPVEACTHAVRTHGVLEHDPSKLGHYRFSHKSFAEALAAEKLVHGALNAKQAQPVYLPDFARRELLSQDAIFSFAYDFIIETPREDLVPGWRAVTFFYPRSLSGFVIINYYIARRLSDSSRIAEPVDHAFTSLFDALRRLIRRIEALSEDPTKPPLSQPTQAELILSFRKTREEVGERAIRLFISLSIALAFGVVLLVSIIRDDALKSFFKDPAFLLVTLGVGILNLLVANFAKGRLGFFSEPTLISYAIDQSRFESQTLNRNGKDVRQPLELLLQKKLQRAPEQPEMGFS